MIGHYGKRIVRASLLAATALGVTALHTRAHAVTYSSPAMLTLVDFGTATSSGLQTTTNPATVGGQTFTFTSSGTPATGVYAGTTINSAESPFTGSSLAKYLSAEPGGSVLIDFSTPQTSFGLLWGSIDSYNSLTFLPGGSATGTTITGADVGSALGFLANGTINENVVISGLSPFTSVLAQSTTPGFEFAPATPIPEPMSLSLLAAGLVGMGLSTYPRSGRKKA